MQLEVVAVEEVEVGKKWLDSGQEEQMRKGLGSSLECIEAIKDLRIGWEDYKLVILLAVTEACTKEGTSNSSPIYIKDALSTKDHTTRLLRDFVNRWQVVLNSNLMNVS